MNNNGFSILDDKSSGKQESNQTLKMHFGFIANQVINSALTKYATSNTLSTATKNNIKKDFNDAFGDKGIKLHESSPLSIILVKTLLNDFPPPLLSEPSGYQNALITKGNDTLNERLDKFITSNEKDIPSSSDIKEKVKEILENNGVT